MRIDDPMWPAVREAARRILRDEDLTLHLPLEIEAMAEELILAIADAQPSKLEFPKLMVHGLDLVDVHRGAMEGQSSHSIRLGPTEPDHETCWIPYPTLTAWNHVMDACRELLLAGYPGCVGCGGPNSEDPWDELQSRKKWFLNQTE